MSLLAILVAVFHAVGSLFLRVLSFLVSRLLSIFQWLGVESEKGGRLALGVAYSIISWIILSCLLYTAIRLTPNQPYIALIILVVSSSGSLFWVLRWTRPQPKWPKAVPIEHFVSFYVLSTFLLLAVLFAFAYLAANKLGGGTSNPTTEGSLATFWEYLRFSVLTASTLGQNNVETKGISCIVECVEVVEFWLFVVILGVRFKPETSK